MVREVKRFLNYWFPVMFCAGVIFYASSMTYHQQDLKPAMNSLFNFEVLRPYLSWVSFTYGGHVVSMDVLGASGFIEFFIRKLAHFSVFFVLGFFTCRLCYYFRWSHRKCFLFAFLFVIAYAISDETHQYFTGDRTPLLQDVIIDSTGGFVGISLYGLYRRNWFFKAGEKLGHGIFVVYFFFIMAIVGVLFFSAGFIQLYEKISGKLAHLINLSVLNTKLSQYPFMYGNTEISVEQLGVSGYVQFFVKKGIIAFIFILLGYLICSLLLRAQFSRFVTFVISTVFVYVASGLFELRKYVQQDELMNKANIALFGLAGFVGVLICLWLKRRERQVSSH